MTMTEATGSGTGRAQGTTRSSAVDGSAVTGSAVTGSAVTSGLVTGRVPYTVPQPPATIDAAVWPSIATVPASLKARVAGRAAEAIFKAVGVAVVKVANGSGGVHALLLCGENLAVAVFD